jgi:hypothetical protein
VHEKHVRIQQRGQRCGSKPRPCWRLYQTDRPRCLP